jgi:hypothetical protein
MHPGDARRKTRASDRIIGDERKPRTLIDPDLLPNPPKWSRTPNKKGRRSPDKRGCWRRDIKKTLNAQYGYPLPHDDAGREGFALLCHAAFAGLSPEDIAQRITWTAALWVDWATRAELDAIIDEVANRPRKLTKVIIGRELGLTQDLRMRPDVKAYSLWPIAYTRAQWKLDAAAKARARSARNYTKRRKGKAMTKKAQCADFLRKTLAYEPAPAARIMRLAVTLGLQKEGAKQFGIPMREACRELGIVRLKKGMGGGWWWGLPQAEKPCFPEGDISRENTPCFLEGDISSSGTKGKPMPVELYGEEAVQEAPAIKGAASAYQQRGGDRAAPAAKAPQPPIEAVQSFLNEATVERGEARSFGSQREQPTGIRQQMIAFQRAVLAMPGVGWRVPARRGPVGGLDLPRGAAQARLRWAPAASVGLGGRTWPQMEPKRVVARV